MIYGSSREGIINRGLNLSTATLPTTTFSNLIGDKQYQHSNHLGNVLATVSDVPLADNGGSGSTLVAWNAYYLSAHTYSSFGAKLADGTTNWGADYRFGFNGMEGDDEVKGDGNSYDFGARMYDARLGRWLSVDPLYFKQASWSTYKALKDNPLIYVDPDGKKEWVVVNVIDQKTGRTTVVRMQISDKLSPQRTAYGTIGHDFSWYYDWYDIEIHYTVVIKKDGTNEWTFSGVRNGVKRATTVTPLALEAWLEMGGEGGTQESGFSITTSSGGTDPTRQKAKKNVSARNMEELLDALGALHPDINYPKMKEMGTGQVVVEGLDKTKSTSEAADQATEDVQKLAGELSVKEIKEIYVDPRSKGPTGTIMRTIANGEEYFSKRNVMISDSMFNPITDEKEINDLKKALVGKKPISIEIIK